MPEVDAFSLAVARILKDAKDRSRYSVRSLAEESGLAKNTVQTYLAGTTVMRVPDFVRLCGLLGMNPKDVIERAQDSL